MPKTDIPRSINSAEEKSSFDNIDSQDILQYIRLSLLEGEETPPSNLIIEADAKSIGLNHAQRAQYNVQVRYMREVRNMYNDPESYPTMEQIKDELYEMGIPIEEEKALFLIYSHIFSSEQEAIETLQYTRADSLRDIESDIERKELFGLVYEAILDIKEKSDPETAERDFDIFCAYMGLNDEGIAYNVDEISKKFNLTPAAIKNIRDKYIRKLVHPHYSRKYRSYFDQLYS